MTADLETSEMSRLAKNVNGIRLDINFLKT
jgi:hypothetical protein